MTDSSSNGAFRESALRWLLAAIDRRAAPYPRTHLVDSLVVLAPHPDDEVLGCGGLIHCKRAAGARVRIVFLSDGAASHRSFVKPEEMRARRAQEAIAAAARLGVDEEDVTLLGFPDGRLTEFEGEAEQALLQLLRIWQPKEIAMPHRWEPVPDHRAVWCAGGRVASAMTGARVLEYGIWVWRTWPVVPFPGWARKQHWLENRLTHLKRLRRLAIAFNEFVPIEKSVDAKRSALEAHESQVARPPAHPKWPILSDREGTAWLEVLLGAREYYRATTVTPGHAWNE